MAWTSMHFAVGMSCAGAATAIGCLITRRGWRWVPVAMTAGGIWAIMPDLPRMFREDFPWLPFGKLLGGKGLEQSLHRWGDLFLFHGRLDAQPHEYALHGVLLMMLLYNLGIALLMFMESRQRNSVANRAWQAHSGYRHRTSSGSSRRRRRSDLSRSNRSRRTSKRSGSDLPTKDGEPDDGPGKPLIIPMAHAAAEDDDDAGPHKDVIARIDPRQQTGS